MTFSSIFTDQFIEIFKEAQPKIAGSTGCNGVSLLQDNKDPCIFFTISYWDDENALDCYRHSDLFITTWARVKPHFSAKPEAWSLLNI